MSISPHASPKKRHRIGTKSEPNRNQMSVSPHASSQKRNQTGTKSEPNVRFTPRLPRKSGTNRNPIGNKSEPNVNSTPRLPQKRNQIGTKSEPNVRFIPRFPKNRTKKVCSAPNGLALGFLGSHKDSRLGFKWVPQRGLGLQMGYNIGLRWASGDLVVQVRCRWVPKFVLVDPTGRFVWGLLSSTCSLLWPAYRPDRGVSLISAGAHIDGRRPLHAASCFTPYSYTSCVSELRTIATGKDMPRNLAKLS